MSIKHDPGIIFQVKGIIKDFPGQRALDEVDFDVYSGEIHGLIGENGAGKSTLIKIIAGAYHPDKGEILIDGKPCSIKNPHQSQALGLAFIHQELNIVPHLSAVENIFLGRYPRGRLPLVSHDRMVEMLQKVPGALDIEAPLDTPAQHLSIVQQWKIVINRALALESRIIFMDEPTSSLTHEEVEDLFKSIMELKKIGKSIVYVSHRIEEVLQIADRITVIRDAKKVATSNVADLDAGKIYNMMLGKEFRDVFPAQKEHQEEVCLEVKNLNLGHIVKNVNFKLHKGEILGIAGLVGSGRTHLAKIIFGAIKKDEGGIYIGGSKVNIRNPKEAIQKGIAMVPEKRWEEGLALSLDIKKNVTASSLKYILKWPGAPFLSRKKERMMTLSFIDSLGIKFTNLNDEVELLSGGNQQKIVFAKCLSTRAGILILDEPTRGIDVGVKFSVYKLITDLAKKGTGIILISSDINEVVGLSHRILIMSRGWIKADLKKSEIDLEKAIKLCSGYDI